MSDLATKAPPGQYLTFKLKSENYGIAIETVREINQFAEITPVPKTPAFVKGVMNLRGKIIPVVNLRVKFGIEAQETTRDTCIIVIESEIGQIGMIVDSVSEVLELKDTQIEPVPHLGNNRVLSFVKGMGKIDNKVLILVDVVAAFSSEQMNQISQLQNAA